MFTVIFRGLLDSPVSFGSCSGSFLITCSYCRNPAALHSPHSCSIACGRNLNSFFSSPCEGRLFCHISATFPTTSMKKSCETVSSSTASLLASLIEFQKAKLCIIILRNHIRRIEGIGKPLFSKSLGNTGPRAYQLPFLSLLASLTA